MAKHKVFISYHHGNDQWAKEQLQDWNKRFDLFHDMSVNTREVDDTLPTDRIRNLIRDDYLRDTSVSIVLVGTETWGRKYVDWEIYSSMYNGSVNKQSGVLIIQLPSTDPKYFSAAHEIEKNTVYADNKKWISVSDRNEYQRRYPYLSDRMIDNLLAPDAMVSVTQWSRIETNIGNLEIMIEAAYLDRQRCKYDLTRPMRQKNATVTT